MRYLMLPLLAVLVGGCGQPAPSVADMACEDGKLPEGAACTTMDECCTGMFCVMFDDSPPVCCHTIMAAVCGDFGLCCPVGK